MRHAPCAAPPAQDVAGEHHCFVGLECRDRFTAEEREGERWRTVCLFPDDVLDENKRVQISLEKHGVSFGAPNAPAPSTAPAARALLSLAASSLATALAMA